MHSRQEKPFSNIYWIRTTFGIFTKSFYRCVFYSFFLKSQNSAYLEKLISHFSLKFFYVRGVKLRGISYLFLQILRVPLRKFSKGFLPFVMQKSYKIEWYFVLQCLSNLLVFYGKGLEVSPVCQMSPFFACFGKKLPCLFRRHVYQGASLFTDFRAYFYSHFFLPLKLLFLSLLKGQKLMKNVILRLNSKCKMVDFWNKDEKVYSEICEK